MLQFSLSHQDARITSTMLFFIFLSLLPLSLASPFSPAATSPFALHSRQLLSFPSHNDIFSCPAASWPPASIGDLLTPQLPDRELQDILGEIDPARIEAIIAKLVSFGTRHTLSSQTDPVRGIGAARDWYVFLETTVWPKFIESIRHLGSQSKCAPSPLRATDRWK